MVSLFFLALSAAAFWFSDMSFTFVLNEVITRFIRDGVMVLALIIPITAGMGINFAITVGAMCVQAAVGMAVDLQIAGFKGLLFILISGITLSVIMGILIGLALNRVKNREMITTIIIGFLTTSIYQLIFMVGYGTVITPDNNEIMLSRGIGIRNMIDLALYRNLIDHIWFFNLGKIDIPLFMIFVVCGFGLMVKYCTMTKLGKEFRVIGESHEKAAQLGIDVNIVRIKAIAASTVIACIGHYIYIQNIGMLNVYSSHTNSDIFSCAALLAGGASITRAKVSHAFLGIFLFHSLFIVSPQAGQNLFGNPALGEYFRSFVAYGTIAFALIMNYREIQ
ncbi:inner-membrane translocator [Candidatus Magnetoovum chiemensis]|nr:inner-membrane translocator [Candidatus Magnetoovum chiemensis]